MSYIYATIDEFLGGMTFAQYQSACARTANPDLDANDALANAGLGISGEAGEVAGEIKKVLFQGHQIDVEHLVSEMGDVLWYIAALSTALGVSLADVASANIAKLRGRYPSGFRPVDSVQR